MKKLYSTLTILGLIHLVPILQGCPPCSTDELFVSATHVEFNFFGVDDDNQFQLDPPYDLKSLGFYIDLSYPDSVLWGNNQPISLITPALATQECDDFFVTIIESIKDFQIGHLKNDGTSQVITEHFFAEKDGLLYQSIADYLESGSMQRALIYSGWEIDLDSASLVFTTTLSDQRVFQDTVKLYLR